jgi:hypothetical protein
MAAITIDTAAAARPNPAMSGPIHLKVFLSSPGDVTEERQAIVRLIKDELPYDPLLRDRVTFDVLAWDDRAQRVALLAGQSGQASVDRALGLPADCDLTVVIVRTRLGTPPDDRPPKPDDTPWTALRQESMAPYNLS